MAQAQGPVPAMSPLPCHLSLLQPAVLPLAPRVSSGCRTSHSYVALGGAEREACALPGSRWPEGAACRVRLPGSPQPASAHGPWATCGHRHCGSSAQ